MLQCLVSLSVWLVGYTFFMKYSLVKQVRAAAKSGNKSLVTAFWCNENDRYCRLGYLPIRLHFWLPNRWSRLLNSLNVIYNAADFIETRSLFGLIHLGKQLLQQVQVEEKLSSFYLKSLN